MKQNIDSQLAILAQILKVDAPPFLLTRINQKIINEEQQFNYKTVWSVASVFVILIIINVALINLHFKVPNNKKNILNAYRLTPNNSLY